MCGLYCLIRSGRGSEVLDGGLDGRGISVRDPQRGASRMKVLRDPVADVADTLDGDAQPLERVAIELVTHCRLQANEHTERRRGRRIDRKSTRLNSSH